MIIYLLQWDEPGGGGGTDSWSSVTNWLVGDGVLSQVVSQHIWLDLYLVESLSVVHTNNATDHLWDDDHVSQVSADRVWLLASSLHSLSSLTELLDKSHALSVQSSLESTALTGRVELNHLVIAHVEELLQVDSTVGVLSEGSLPWCVSHFYIYRFKSAGNGKKDG